MCGFSNLREFHVTAVNSERGLVTGALQTLGSVEAESPTRAAESVLKVLQPGYDTIIVDDAGYSTVYNVEPERVEVHPARVEVVLDDRSAAWDDFGIDYDEDIFASNSGLR